MKKVWRIEKRRYIWFNNRIEQNRPNGPKELNRPKGPNKPPEVVAL